MKIYNPLCLLAIGLFFSTYSQATINIGSLSWGEASDKNSAFISYRTDYDPDSVKRSINVLVQHDKYGEQRFYIDTFNPSDNAKCSTYSKTEITTMTFNGQAVKMTKFCGKFVDSDVTYYYYTPNTEKGHLFIINLFKTSTAPIELVINGETLYVPVKGFTKVWNSAGGNAI